MIATKALGMTGSREIGEIVLVYLLLYHMICFVGERVLVNES